MLEGLFWIFIAVLIGVPASLGCYLVLANSDKLTVKYQNYQLARTMQPLKDEDFSNMPRIIWLLKAVGVLLLVFSAGVVYYVTT
ncbi:hypothetical protein H5P28_14840 [Ruficoccus amylovorans]|uniref:Uncharacterized protein n=1 Tax=Ruficoccus amylovorans TaxID=1804625 RepID=A0A842HK56_9BACT|nr:hypothetical protein [Ruficoccus amylovorans]MBC2595541.1 hypothetical protein [Ruficoccus amylovorans]